MNYLSICSGIEAATVAWKPLGWKHIGFAEIEKFPSAVLAHHYPNVPNHGDFTKIKTGSLPHVDIICGGTPCQAFSVAGARNSLDDARGNLTLAFVGLVHELAVGNGLRNAVWENVPGVLSTHDNAFGCFLAGLVGADGPFVPALAKPAAGKSNRAYGWSAKSKSHYIKWPRAGLVTGPKGRAAWTVKDAQYFGLAQRRERVIVVADFGSGADPAAVLFEPESVPRYSPPSREAGERVAPTISARPTGGGGLGTDFDLDGGWNQSAVTYALGSHAGAANGDQTNRNHESGGPVGSNISEELAYSLRAGRTQSVAYAPPIARCVATREGSSQDYESTTMVAVVHGTQDPCTNEHVAFALQQNSGRENVICFSAKDYGADATNNLFPTLRAGGHSASHANAGVMPAVAYSIALRGRDDGATAELGSDVAFALRAAGGGGDKPHVLTNREELRAFVDRSDVPLSAVRRLTPRECERLQGFPDDYTAIPWRGKPADQCPDGPRYKALGNSWAVPKFRWLGERIARLMPAEFPAVLINEAAE